MTRHRSQRGNFLLKALVVLVLWVGLSAGAYYLVVVLPGGGASPNGGSPTPDPAGSVNWDAERIASQPQRYLEHVERRVEVQLATVEQQLEDASRRRENVERRARELSRNLTDIENLNQRMKRAYEAADDENRWPLRMAGRTFDRARAESIIEQTGRYVQTRRPLVGSYDEALAKLHSAEASLQRARDQLQQMHEQVRLDRQRLGADPRALSPSQLRRFESELAALAQARPAASVDEPAPADEGVTAEAFLD